MKKEINITIPESKRKRVITYCDICGCEAEYNNFTEISLEHFKEEDDRYSIFEHELDVDTCQNCYNWDEYSADVSIIEKKLKDLFLAECQKIEKKIRSKCLNLL